MSSSDLNHSHYWYVHKLPRPALHLPLLRRMLRSVLHVPVTLLLFRPAIQYHHSAHYTDSLVTVYLNEAWGGLWIDEQGNPLELKMIAPEDEAEAWFDKEHSLALGKRATALGMSYLPSFHYSDTWMSNAKAYTPEEWLDTDYENTYKNTDLSHMQSIVYNYVYDFMKSLKDNNVNVCGVKHGNEQNK